MEHIDHLYGIKYFACIPNSFVPHVMSLNIYDENEHIIGNTSKIVDKPSKDICLCISVN